MSLLAVSLWGILLLVLLAIESEFLAKGSEVLEKKFGAGFTGSVVLGFITMIPELVFVLVAVKAMEYEVALGSAVGGNILLFTIGFGMVILVAYFKHKETILLPNTMKDDLIYLLVGSLYLFFASLKGYFGIIDGTVLFVMYIVFVVHQYIETKNLPKEEHTVSAKEWGKSITFLLIGGIGLLFTAEPFVESIVEISELTGVSALILALIISPLASELPEKISAFSLASKSMKGAEIAVANFIGSKVQASTLLFGSMVLFKIFLSGDVFYIAGTFSQIMLAIITTLVGIWITYDLKLKLKEGWVIVLLYFVTVLIAIYY